VPTPGHTPGHISVRAKEGSEAGLFLGDVIHSPVQMADPDLNSAYCEIPAVARQSRRAMLEYAAETDALLVPGHFLAPHIGRVRREASHYQFVPGVEVVGT
jgi:glyoxylase-like metal-dependent hydrolase (beta-lactamase superfamily II)